MKRIVCLLMALVSAAVSCSPDGHVIDGCNEGSVGRTQLMYVNDGLLFSVSPMYGLMFFA